MNIQSLFPIDLTVLLSLQSKGLSGVFSSTTVWKCQFFGAQPSLWSNSHNACITTGKTISLTVCIFISKVMSLLFNVQTRFVIVFLSRSKCLLISWLQSPSAGILEPKKIKSVTASTFPLSICHEVMCHDQSFMNVEFQVSFFSLLFHPYPKAL